ncbi:hypothetical protein AGMMS50212_03990 [Spirochaetia bacterium]|nr:hypothetical protein AGMMS50212_03990 [Spirochaetia bacterium]
MNDEQACIELRELFGNNLKKLRHEARLSLIKLGMRSGLTHNFINDLEHGKRGVTLDSIALLAQGLDVESFKLLLPKEKAQESAYPEYINALEKAVEDIKKYYSA